MYQPVYEEKGLLGATYQVIAVEDVVTGDGTIRYKAGDVVDEVTTGEDGSATTDELYLGHYQVVEVVAPDGYVLNATPTDVELVYAGQEVSVVDAATGFNNDRQKLRIKAMKFLEQDETFGIGMNGEIKSVSFGLYAKEEIIAADGSVIPADGLIEIAFCAEDGSVVFQSDVPFGKYYVKEYAADDHYLMSGTAYVFEFAYAGQEISFVITEFNTAKRRIIGDRKQLLVAEKQKRQEEVLSKISVGQTVEGTVKNVTDFGVFIDIGGVDGLLHISEMSWGRIENPKKVFKPGDHVKAFIKDIQGDKIALSLKFEDTNPWPTAEQKYAVGNVVKGKVARMTDFGAFVELEPGIDALLHVSQIALELSLIHI